MAALLDGVRIVDMTSVLMGPYATQILADYGADVIKVEAPAGDTTRQVPPMRSPNMGTIYLHLNRNKRSLVLDLKREGALDALLKLLETADVFVSNVRPKALARLGLDSEVLSRRNPRLVVASLVGFGQDGPYAADPAYEDLIQALTTVPSLLVAAGSEQPHYVPVAYNDRSVGQSAAIAIMAALFERERSGLGQCIEVPMFETMVQNVMGDHLGGLTFEPPLGPPGYQRTLNRERRPYPTKDGHVCVIIYTDKHWERFGEMIGRPGLLEDPRFKDLTARTVHAPAVYALIAETMPQRTTAEWLAAFRAADIPVAPMHTLTSIMDDPHLKATGFFRRIEHPSEGAIYEMAIPSKWSRSKPSIRRHAPQLGEHSREVLSEAGLSDTEIDALVESGGAAQSPRPGR
ncbi:CaiB/BaiF CoA transferase family protein [Thauera sinica]|uniref:CaiB/BaiF CoA transferase family protein n=1 Tax=Thauera sinica TaxID=2665146 RepID=A0ABW1AXM8_9RHOO|nr:CoA transferase [Thauera sp. K11]ATE58759.1 CoA transferase [Thauera sp. K11]